MDNRIEIFYSDKVRAAQTTLEAGLKAELSKLGLTPKVTLDQVVAYAVHRFETNPPPQARIDEAYGIYTEYMQQPPEEKRITLEPGAEKAVQAIGERMSTLGGIRSRKGYNRKLIVLLAMLTMGQGTA